MRPPLRVLVPTTRAKLRFRMADRAFAAFARPDTDHRFIRGEVPRWTPDPNDPSALDHALASVIARGVTTLPCPVFVTELDDSRAALGWRVSMGPRPQVEGALVEALRVLDRRLALGRSSRPTPLVASEARDDAEAGSIAATLCALRAGTLSAAGRGDLIPWLNAAKDTTCSAPAGTRRPCRRASDAARASPCPGGAATGGRAPSRSARKRRESRWR
jgi:hypothetical protein